MTIDPADYRVVGSSGIERPAAAAAGGSWRGCLLTKNGFESWQTLEAGGGNDAISFDAAPYDTDGFATTGSHTFGSVTVPAGSGVMVPVGSGLAGLYRVSGQIAVGIGPDAGGYAFQTRIQRSAGGGDDDDFPQNYSSTSIYGLGAGVVISPGLLRLAEGDVVWWNASNDSSGADAVILTKSWLLVEYLIPWALGGT